jgi:hypothetical protein
VIRRKERQQGPESELEDRSRMFFPTPQLGVRFKKAVIFSTLLGSLRTETTVRTASFRALALARVNAIGTE